MNDRVDWIMQMVRDVCIAVSDSCDAGEADYYDAVEPMRQEIRIAIERLARGGEVVAVGDIVAEDMGRPFNAMQIRVNFPNGAPPIGTRLYTTPPATVPQSEHDALKAELDDIKEKLKDPGIVRANMMRGIIADPYADLNQRHDDLCLRNERLQAEHDKTLARVRELEAFVCKIAEQRPSKPDYWSSCSQCESNTDTAEELLAAHRTDTGEGE